MFVLISTFHHIYMIYLLLLQNFFTTVKALVSQAAEGATVSDGYHHFEQPEQDLLASYVILSGFILISRDELPFQFVREPIRFPRSSLRLFQYSGCH